MEVKFRSMARGEIPFMAKCYREVNLKVHNG